MSDHLSHEVPAREASALPIPIPTRLIGREAALTQIYGQLKNSKPVFIYGAPGLGKTAIAATLANAYTQQPGGVLWLNVDNDSLESLLVRVGRAYNLPEVTSADNPLSMVGAVAAVLMQQKPLIVLDGRIGAQIASKFVTRCADRLPVIIISREHLEGPWTEFKITPLEAPASLALFKHDAVINDNSADADIAALVKTLSYHPFAISLAARAMLASKQTPAAFNAALTQIVQSLGNNNPSNLALTASFAPLNGALQGVVLVLSATFSGEASGELLSMVAGAPEDSINQAMNMLVGLRLVDRVQRYGKPYYRLHMLTQSFAQDRLKASSRLEALQQKALDQTLAYVQKYAASSTDDAYNKLAAESDNIMAAARWASTNGKREIASQLANALGTGGFSAARGYHYEVSMLRGLAAGSGAAFPAYPQESAALPPEEIEVSEKPKADIFKLLDEIDSDIEEEYDLEDEDLLEEDLEESEPLVVPPPSATVIQRPPVPAPAPEDLLDVEDEEDEEALGDVDELLEDLELEASDEIDYDEVDEAEEAAAIIDSLMESAQVETASPPDEITRLRTSLLQARQHNDAKKQVEILQEIAKLHLAQSRDNEAISTYAEALNVYEGMSDKRGALETLEMLSALTVKTDNAQASVMYAGHGVKMAEELGDAETQMLLLMTLGDARQQLGESEEAEKAYAKALEISRKRSDSQHEAIILYKLGYAQLDNGSAQVAIENWEQSLRLFRIQMRREYEGKVMGALGSAYGELGRWAEASSFHTSALYIAREVVDREEEAVQLSSLGYASIQGNQLPQAVLRYRQALHLAYQAGDRSNIVSIIVDLVRLLMRSMRHLSVCELLVEDALTYDSKDKDLITLEEQIAVKKQEAQEAQVPMVLINGTARDYASNAYRLLDE